MNIYENLFGVALSAPRVVVDIIAITSGGFIAEELGKGGAVMFCFGDAEVGDRVVINQNGQVIQKLEKLEWVEIII